MPDNMEQFIVSSKLLLNAAGEGIYGFNVNGTQCLVTPQQKK